MTNHLAPHNLSIITSLQINDAGNSSKSAIAPSKNAYKTPFRQRPDNSDHTY
ncbi:hypothetical protein [Nostoc sp.]|uniref:hypothetical protein n=1 Tax=Nostoc sp. TaxID=1180 RepID=UPI003593C89B